MRMHLHSNGSLALGSALGVSSSRAACASMRPPSVLCRGALRRACRARAGPFTSVRHGPLCSVRHHAGDVAHAVYSNVTSEPLRGAERRRWLPDPRCASKATRSRRARAKCGAGPRTTQTRGVIAYRRWPAARRHDCWRPRTPTRGTRHRRRKPREPRARRVGPDAEPSGRHGGVVVVRQAGTRVQKTTALQHPPPSKPLSPTCERGEEIASESAGSPP